MQARTGILIAGSLYWSDLAHRVNWRRNDLEEASGIDVNIPIRYGRRSSSGSYTMVFDPACPLGRGKILGCRQTTTSLQDLVRQAQSLWLAESPDGSARKPSQTLAAGWGCVVLLVNPASTVPKAFLEEWESRVAQERTAKSKCYDSRAYSVNGTSAISDDGRLQIDWPVLNDAGGPVETFDFLLATATKPTPDPATNDYASAELIADAWRRAGNSQYFDENRKHGFHTFQDDAIMRNLEKR